MKCVSRATSTRRPPTSPHNTTTGQDPQFRQHLDVSSFFQTEMPLPHRPATPPKPLEPQPAPRQASEVRYSHRRCGPPVSIRCPARQQRQAGPVGLAQASLRQLSESRQPPLALLTLNIFHLTPHPRPRANTINSDGTPVRNHDASRLPAFLFTHLGQRQEGIE